MREEQVKFEERDRSARSRLVRSIVFYALGAVVIHLLAARILARHLTELSDPAGFYLWLAIPWTLLIALIILGRMKLLYTIKGQALDRLNLATRVTLVRVLIIPLIAVLIRAGKLEIAGIAFLIAALTDWLDGFIARRIDVVTQLGRIIDPSIDAVFCALSFLALCLTGWLPEWLLILVAIRYALLATGSLILKAVLGEMPVRATFAGRFFYFLQYSLLVALLLFPHWPYACWIHWVLGMIQVLVSVQLLFLGFGILREARS